MSYTIPNVPEFKDYFDRDFPFSTGGVNATATATADVTGVVVSLVPDGLGQGYTSAPTVSITDEGDGPGHGATATASISNGQVTGYSLTAGGSGYVNPIVTVKGGGVDDTSMLAIRGKDVQKALDMAGVNFNVALWANQTEVNIAYLLKAAHFLCLNLKASALGLKGRGAEALRNAFNVGEISAAYQLPDRIVNSRILGPYLETTYGYQYLQILAPRIVANVQTAWGHTKP